MVVRDLLVRGLLVGLLAGVVAFGVAELLGEPQVNRAIVVETRIDQQLVRQPAPAIVSRAIQSSVGLATGVLVLAATFGGLFALAFAFAYGRIGRAGARVTAVLVAAAGFCAIYLVPFLKYPANPPSVGQPSTIDHRTELYFAMVLISVLTMIGAIVLGASSTRASVLGTPRSWPAARSWWSVRACSWSCLASTRSPPSCRRPSCGGSGSPRSPPTSPCGRPSVFCSGLSPSAARAIDVAPRWTLSAR